MSSSSISPLFFLMGTGLILVAVTPVWYWQRGKPSFWPAFWWGVLAWAASMAPKAAVGLPSLSFLQRHANSPLTWLYGGLLTGVFECGIPLLLILKTRLRRADFSGTVAFGIGFGAPEAFLMGSASLVQTVLVVAFPNHIPPSMRDTLLEQFVHSSIAMMLLSIVERAFALGAHCLASVLLIYAVRTQRQLWFWLSFAYKTVIDAFAAWAILAWKMPGSPTKRAEFEAVFAIFVLITLPALPRLKTGFLRLEQREPTSAPSASAASTFR